MDFQIYIFTTSNNETVWTKWAASAREYEGIYKSFKSSIVGANPLDQLHLPVTNIHLAQADIRRMT